MALAQARSGATGTFPGYAGAGYGLPESQSPLLDAWDRTVGIGWGTQVYSGATGLPRAFDTFREGQFGPFEPIWPVPIDRGEQPSGRPRPRRWQFPVGWNLPVGQPGTEGIKLASFQVLRDYAEIPSIPRALIELAKADIEDLSWDIVPTTMAQFAMQGNPKKRADWEKRKDEVVQFWENPDPDNYDGFDAWLNALLEDQLVLDAVALYKHPTLGSSINFSGRNGHGPCGSDLGALTLLDGSTIRPLLDDWGGKPRPPQPSYQQVIWGVPRVDLMDIINLGPNATIDDLKAINSVLAELSTTGDEWAADQLMYLIQNPRNMTPYGFGPLEQAMLPASILLARQTWQYEFYRSGSLPQVFLDPGATIANAEEARQLQEAINMMGGDMGAKHQVIVLPPGSRVTPQKTVDLTDQFDEWLTVLLCMPFGYSIADLGVAPKVASLQSPAASKGAAQTATDRGTQHAIMPRIKKLKRYLFDRVIQKIIGQEDMQWSWGIVERGDTKDQQVARSMELFKGSLSTLDESRIALEMEPLGIKGISDVPLVFTTNGALPISSILAVQQTNLQQAQAQTQAILNPPTQQVPTGGKPPGGSKTPDRSASTPRGPRTRTAPPPKNVKPASGRSKPPAVPRAGNATALERGAQAAEANPNQNPQVRARKSAVDEELAVLRRYLKGGKRVEKFQPNVLRKSALHAAYGRKDNCYVIVKQAQQHQDRRTNDLAGDQDHLLRSFSETVERLKAHQHSPADALGHLKHVLGTALRHAFHFGSLAAMSDLGIDPDEVPAQARIEAEKVAEHRMTEQEPYLRDYLTDAVSGTNTPAESANRASMWASSLVAPYEHAYVFTSGEIAASRGENYRYRWHLGDSEHCALCLQRDGKVFTRATLPGMPGDGGFGATATVCLGGPRCACWVSVETTTGQLIGQSQSPSIARLHAVTGQKPAWLTEKPDFSEQLATQDVNYARRDEEDRLRYQMAQSAARNKGKGTCAYCDTPPTQFISLGQDRADVPVCTAHALIPEQNTTYEITTVGGDDTDPVQKDFSMGSPLSTGMVPFTLSGPEKEQKPKKHPRKKTVLPSHSNPDANKPIDLSEIAARYPTDEAAEAAMASGVFDPMEYAVRGSDIVVKAMSAVDASEPSVTVGGLAVRAEDTGRVLLLQRSNDESDDPAAGLWEFAGGHIEAGETPFAGAVREWSEEVGLPLPAGHVVGMWESPNGIYQGFVYSVPSEATVQINLDYPRVENPDAPLHAKPDTAAWWDITELNGMPALRPELQHDLPTVLAELRKPVRHASTD